MSDPTHTPQMRATAGPNRPTRIIGLTAAAAMDAYSTKPVRRALLLERLSA